MIILWTVRPETPGMNQRHPEPTGEPVSITVSMVGDCTLGTDINFDQSTSFDAFYQMKNDPDTFSRM